MKQRPLLVLFGGGAALALLALLALHLYPGDPLYYYSDPLSARVIDEQTTKPIEGAVVIAVWIMESRYIHPIDKLVFKAEAATGADGKFVIPPLPRMIRPFCYGLDWRDPLLIVYKPGYMLGEFDNRPEYVAPGIMGIPRVRHNTVLPDGRVVVVKRSLTFLAKRRAFWNEKSLSLTPAPDFKTEAQAFAAIHSKADGYRMNPRRFPKIWSALVAGYKRLPPGTAEAESETDPQEFIRWWKEHPDAKEDY